MPDIAHIADTPLMPSGVRVKASPLARKLAAKNNLSLIDMTGSGPSGRIIKRDIEAALDTGGVVLRPPLEPAAPAFLNPKIFFKEDEYEVEPLTPMLSAIADRLVLAKQHIPHYQLSIDIKLTTLLTLRTKLNAALMDTGTGEKLSVNDFIIRAAALSLVDVPAVNSAFTEDAFLRYKNADISVAVALPSGGLITPIIKAVQTKSVREIAREVKSLAQRAADMRLKPEEYEGGTFSVSNLGMFGVSEFNAIINPPQAAILAVGSAEKFLEMNQGDIRYIDKMRVTLSCDHRVINGAQGAEFLAAFKKYMEWPLDLLF